VFSKFAVQSGPVEPHFRLLRASSPTR